MEMNYYHIDTFTETIFHGNPAGVCILTDWLPDTSLHAIARENNLPVTVFLLQQEQAIFQVRWITPEYELDICGHGSLAAGFVIFNFLEPLLNEVILESRTASFPIRYEKDFVILNFPEKKMEECRIPLLTEGLGLAPLKMYQHQNERCLAVYQTEEDIKNLNPNPEILKKIPHRGITVTAPGNSVDFVSRTFYPQKQSFEDAVTGASHCLLVPLWAKELNKTRLSTKQLSARGGELICEYQPGKIELCGKAVLYGNGIIQCSI